MSLLDILEERCTRKYEHKPRGPFAARLQPFVERLHQTLPERDLKSTDCYSFSLCLRCTLRTVTPLILVYTSFWIIGITCIGISVWHSDPALFHFGRWQAHVWHGLWRALWPGFVKQGFILLPFVPLMWTLFSFALYLPRMFFWNRRAKRLQSTAEAFSLPQISAALGVMDTAQTDASVWPPPPKHDDLWRKSFSFAARYSGTLQTANVSAQVCRRKPNGDDNGSARRAGDGRTSE